MPKVTEEYFAVKKRKIIDAAVRVCQSKPAYEITLRDVVRKCGISTGGIYNYFASIDEIFAEILNQAYDELSEEFEVEKVFESRQPPEEIIMDFFVLRGRMIDRTYHQYGKFIYELQSICLNDPERGKKMLAILKPNSDGLDLLAKLRNFIDKHIANGSFNSAMPTGQIMFIIVAASDGIKKALIDPDSSAELAYIGLPEDESATAESMMKILAQVIINLLGIE